MAVRPRSGRGPIIAKATLGTFPGTENLVRILVDESVQQSCWRPVRAAAEAGRAAKQAPASHVWMHTWEFAAWVERFTAPKGMRLGHIETELGIKPWRRSAMLDGAKIMRTEALACAHLAAGLPLPFSPITPEALADWFIPRFGAAEAVARVLGLKGENIIYWMRGFEITEGRRIARRPGVALVRALDWVWRVGPYSPYGDRLPVSAFPGQMENPS